MFCSLCKKRDATIHIDQFKNGRYIFVDVCEKCAVREKLIPYQADINKILEEALEKIIGSSKINLKETTKIISLRNPRAIPEPKIEAFLECPECGFKSTDFDESKIQGCTNDYILFREKILAKLQEMNNSITYEGIPPAAHKKESEARLELRKLKAKLKEAISQEDFETAAELRDQILEIEKL
jgi:protein arginine kinase activator